MTGLGPKAHIMLQMAAPGATQSKGVCRVVVGATTARGLRMTLLNRGGGAGRYTRNPNVHGLMLQGDPTPALVV